MTTHTETHRNRRRRLNENNKRFTGSRAEMLITHCRHLANTRLHTHRRRPVTQTDRQRDSNVTMLWVCSSHDLVVMAVISSVAVTPNEI